MNQDIKIRWCTALRSGEYKQTKGYLKNNEGYCCLGVLSDLYAKEKNAEWTSYGYMLNPVEEAKNPEMLTCNNDDVNGTLLADEVAEWAGLKDNAPDVMITKPDGTTRDRGLAELNDEGKTFVEIADLIEATL
jgi:hypothetical protein